MTQQGVGSLIYGIPNLKKIDVSENGHKLRHTVNAQEFRAV